MTIEERNNLFRDFFENECMATMTVKGGDYAGDNDANRNFKHVGASLGLTKYQTWAVYFNKHVDAVNNSIKRNPERPERKAEGIKESLKDIMNYAGILLSMLEEDAHSIKNLELGIKNEERSPSVPLTSKGEVSLNVKGEHKRDQKVGEARTLRINGEEKEIYPFLEKKVGRAHSSTWAAISDEIQDPDYQKQEEHLCKCQEADCCQGGGN